ncbi:ST14 [Branchiostoma lanceolatum]|uniref:ST14 protein n=1 Tax=Branchiostoma lanceolatum TaxID=7740 RepID=A0A8K0EG01_BRALA|nr:ST14 [Branchiostoma lanceolatum]
MADVLGHLSALVLLLGVLARQCSGQVPEACRWKTIGRPEDVGGALTSGILQSPRLPGVSGYPEKLDCVWRIWAKHQKKIKVIIRYMDLPPREADGKCSEDFLIIRDLSGNQHWTFCGQEKATCLISTLRDLHVNFVTSDKPNKKLRHFRGWTIQYLTVDASDPCPATPTPEAPLTTPPVGRETKSTKPEVMTPGLGPTHRGCEGPGCSANLTTTTEVPGGSGSAVVIFLAVTVAILSLAGAVCLGWWCWSKRRGEDKRQRPAEEMGPSAPHPDVITFRVGEEKTSLMDANYGKPVGPVPPNYGNPVSPVPSKPLRKTADCPFPVPQDAEWRRVQEPLLAKHLKVSGVSEPKLPSPPPVPSGRYILPPAPGKEVIVHDVTPYGYSDVLLRDRIETQQPYPDPCYAEIDEGIVRTPETAGEQKEKATAPPIKPARGGSYPPYATVYKPGNLEAPVKPKRAPPQKSPRGSLNPKPDVVGDVTRPSNDYYEVPMVTAPPRKPPRSFEPKKAGINFPRLSDGSDDGYAVPIGTVTTNDQSKPEYDRLDSNGSHGNGNQGNSPDSDYHHLGEGSNDYDHLARGIVDQRKQRGQMSNYDRLPELEA